MIVSELPFPAAIPRQRWSWIATQVRNIFIMFLREVFKMFTRFTQKRRSYCAVKNFKSYRARIGPYSAHVPPLTSDSLFRRESGDWMYSRLG